MKYIFVIGFVFLFKSMLLIPLQSEGAVSYSKSLTQTTDSTTAMQQGKAIYEQNCGHCHHLKKPESHSESKWKEIVPRMVIKANKKAKQTVISTDDEAQLLAYLVAVRKASGKK